MQEKNEKLQRIGIYVSLLAIADSMLIGYRTLFLTIETLLLGLGIGLLAIEKIQLLWIPVSIGLLFCLAVFCLFSWGIKRVDYWRDKIFEEVKKDRFRGSLYNLSACLSLANSPTHFSAFPA